MLKAELEQKLASLTADISQVNAKIKELAKQRTEVIDRGDVDVDNPGAKLLPALLSF